jgi:hypothetical protein
MDKLIGTSTIPPKVLLKYGLLKLCKKALIYILARIIVAIVKIRLHKRLIPMYRAEKTLATVSIKISVEVTKKYLRCDIAGKIGESTNKAISPKSN